VINLNQLNEKQSRIYLASEALSYGWDGITLISKLSGVSQTTIQLGIKELNKEVEMASADKIRRAGAGRKREKDKQQGLEEAVLELVEGHTIGDPMRVIINGRVKVQDIFKESYRNEVLKYRTN
jgi:transcriptional antiterminator